MSQDNIVQLRVIDGDPLLIDLTREELTVISDVLSRVEPIWRGLPRDPVGISVAKPEFPTALAKIDGGKDRARSAAGRGFTTCAIVAPACCCSTACRRG